MNSYRHFTPMFEVVVSTKTALAGVSTQHDFVIGELWI